MYRKLFLRAVKLLLIFSLYPGRGHTQCLSVLPAPRHCSVTGKNYFVLSDKTAIFYKKDIFQTPFSVFSYYLEKWRGLKIKRSTAVARPASAIEIIFEKQADTAGYRLDIKPGIITIRTGTSSGAGNAFATLLQMVLADTLGKHNFHLGACRISDYPAFAWRGFMLDESRHFFGKKEVKKLLDQMYLFKLNRFHWHLTDEPGWRLSVQKYPRLSSVGGRGNYSDSAAAPKFYQAEDVKEIVAYASARNITVIAEIDMPGHARAANRAYPQFSGGGSAQHPDFTFNPGVEAVYGYLSDILRETSSLFPARMIHIGGDEVSVGDEKWNTDTSIRHLKNEQHLKDNAAVEQYFLRRMADSVRKMGVKVIGWDEITDAGLPKDSTIIMWWRHDKKEQLMRALAGGYPVVLCPRIPFYLDFVQTQRDKTGRRWDGTFCSSSILGFSVDSLVPQQFKNQIMGMQANLWTETVTSTKRLEYLVFPRLVALSAAAWSPGLLDDIRFKNSLRMYYPLWKRSDIYYFNPSDPQQSPEVNQ